MKAVCEISPWSMGQFVHLNNMLFYFEEIGFEHLSIASGKYSRDLEYEAS
jgi:hypothetical protein